MVDFEAVRYIASRHSLDQVIDRFPGTHCDHAKGILEAMAYEGELLIQCGEYRYLRHGSFFLPTSQIGDKVFRIITVLTWDMVEKGDGYGLQLEVNKYMKKALPE